MKAEKICLRINASISIKFCISIHISDGLNELRKVICKVLDECYDVQINDDFAIKTEDGYDIVPIFSVGDVLSNNQSIFIDHLCPGRSHNYGATKKSRNNERNNEYSESKSGEELKKYYEKKRDYLKEKEDAIKKSMKALKKNRFDSNSTDKKVVDEPVKIFDNEEQADVKKPKKYINDEVREDNKNGSIITENSDSLVTTNNKNVPSVIENSVDKTHYITVDNTISAPVFKNSMTNKQIQSPTQQIFPIFDSKFKGFAVKKNDLSISKSSQMTPTEDFKPLRKRKQAEAFELI